MRARIDRLGALYANADYPRVLGEYQGLVAAQQEVPDWAIGWVMSAYLEQQNIAAAQALLADAPAIARPLMTIGTPFFSPYWIPASTLRPGSMKSG